MGVANEVGLVDELVAPEQVTERAVEYLEGLLALPPVAMNRTRLVGKARLIEALGESDDVERTTADWFSEETQSAMKALVENLRKD
jgi:enoyl-CoA hydratase/carnithine racemase